MKKKCLALVLIFLLLAGGLIPAQAVVDRTGIADRIIISAFFPPCREDMGWGPMTFQPGSETDDYHYRMMAECGVDFIENVWSSQMQSREENLHIAALCDKYGMWLFVQEAWEWQTYWKDNRQPHHYLLDLTQQQLEDYVNFWKDVPGVGGFFLYDEADDDTSNPYSMAAYGALAAKVKKLAPDLIVHTSDAPGRSIASINGLINSAKSYEGLGYKPDHIGDCEYPFQSGVNGAIKYTWFKYLDNYRRIGLEYGIKTSRYLQLNAGWDGPVAQSRYKVMEKNQIRYELYSGLAYGVKKFGLFSWNIPPVEQGAYWEGSVLNRDGSYTPMYGHLKDLLGQVHALSDVIFPLEARSVYSTVDKRGGTLNLEKFTTKPPRTFLAQSGDSRDMLYSYMVNPADGTRYLMVVNNATASDAGPITHTINFNTASGLEVVSLTEVSHADGSLLAPVDLRSAHSA
ncbi:MAG: hypothetical protein FWF86_08245, partial [Clostridia bacterium]|nr:hypothetical protein [Clostridia bacterium]